MRSRRCAAIASAASSATAWRPTASSTVARTAPRIPARRRCGTGRRRAGRCERAAELRRGRPLDRDRRAAERRARLRRRAAAMQRSDARDDREPEPEAARAAIAARVEAREGAEDVRALALGYAFAVVL